MKELYVGMDLYSRNTYTGIIDKGYKRVFKKRLVNDLSVIAAALEPFRNKIQSHFSGKLLLKAIDFNPKIDAVTSATISSKLVFDSLDNTRPVYEKSVEMEYIAEKKK